MISAHLHTDKPRVLFLSRWYPGRYDSMLGLFVQRHAEVMASAYQVTVISLHGSEGKANPLFGLYVTFHKEEVLEIRVYYRKKAGGIPFLNPVINTWRYAWAFLKAWKHYRRLHGLPCLIHVNVLTRNALIAFLLKCRYGIPYIITEHWSRYLPESFAFKGVIRRWISRKTVKKAMAVSAVSRRLKKAMQNAGLEHKCFKLVYNYIDTVFFQPVPKDKQNAKVNFLHVSCFDERSKNISGIIQVAARLLREGYDFTLTMTGNDPDFDIAGIYKKYEVTSHNLVFKGVLEGEELAGAFREADYLVLFSNYETFGIVVYEGMAAGVPVISTNTADIAEHLDEHKGMMIEPGDLEALYNRMKYCIESRPVYDKAHLRQYAVKHFSKEAVFDQINELYQIALKKQEC
ncbi:MAG: glycosyltransferase [Bacteroidales bacterium]